MTVSRLGLQAANDVVVEVAGDSHVAFPTNEAGAGGSCQPIWSSIDHSQSLTLPLKCQFSEAFEKPC